MVPMRRRPILPAVVCTLVLFQGVHAAWAVAPTGEADADSNTPQAAPSRSVLLITIDTLRADHLGCYGYRRGATPAIDALAKQATKFEHAFSAVPLTLPSHAALLTGTYPFYNGVRDQPGFRLSDNIPSLPEYFARAGYATAAVLGSPVLSRRFGLSRGFDAYDDHFGASTEELEAVFSDTKRPAETVVRLGLAWLDSKPAGKPYFLWLHFYDPHMPYVAPEPFRSRFADRPYDSEVAYTDSALATLFAGLRKRGLFETTVIALTADHGEGLGDHGESTHGYFIYDSTLHVPLLVKAAGEAAHPTDVKTPVSLVDLAPTLLRLVGIKVPANMQGTEFSGSILAGEEPRPHPVYAETMYPLLHLGWNPLRALVSETPGRQVEKYIQAPHPELYDLGSDPGEAHNKNSSSPAEAAARREQLDAFVKTHAPAKPAAGRGPVSAKTAALFSSLGYLASAGAPDPEWTTSRRDPKDCISENEQLLHAAHEYQALHYDAAARILEDVLRQDPQQPHALDYLGTIQFLRHDLEGARATYKRLVQAAPYYSTAYIQLGHVEALLGNRSEAERLYRLATETDPSNPRPPRELGTLLLADGKTGPAEEMLRQALQLDPGDVLALAALGEAAALEQHYAEAATLLQRVLDAEPARHDLTVMLNLGFVYLKLRRFTDVERLMKVAIELDPRQAQAYALLGAACHESGDHTGAREAFQHALALDPHNRLALQGAQALGLAPPP
jgi:arylsulfatase A-like enzyme/tetratricopeptide (TPR) repeat protein